MKYFNSWEKIDDVHKDFLYYGEWDEEKRLKDFPTDEEILFASYEQGGYEGDSLVLFRRDGNLYYNSASHCSCYGLEGQWGPDEVIPEQLTKMHKPYEDHGDDAIKAWKKIMQEIGASIESPNAPDLTGDAEGGVRLKEWLGRAEGVARPNPQLSSEQRFLSDPESAKS